MSESFPGLWLRLYDRSHPLNDHFLLAAVILLTMFYLSLVRFLRFRAVKQLHNTYSPYVKDPYSMDYKTAHEISKLAMLYDVPWMYYFGTTQALIKTYGIASGTSLLAQTRQLTTDAKVGKRAEDTAVLLSEFVVGSVDSERGMRALSKVNWLHRRYGARVGNEEMIHTLAMFVLEPQRWIEKFEWRPMTQLEKVAMFIYWKEIGNRMGIVGIPPTLEELQDWTESFEKVHMVYSDNNRLCAETTMNLYLRNVPRILKHLARDAANSLLEERLRLSLGSPRPRWWVGNLVFFLFQFRAWVVAHLFLPRLHEIDVMARPGKDGRLQRDNFAFEPWYVKNTWWMKLSARWQSLGRLSPSTEYKSAGYLPEEVGPAEYEKSSKESVLSEAEAMKKYAAAGGAEVMGCPFSFSSKK